MNRRDSSIFLEYQRMREEKEIKEIHDNIPTQSMFDIPGITNVMPSPKAEMTSVDGDMVDGAPFKPSLQHLEAKELPNHRHGARLCTISAALHMKHLANRKPKTMEELRRNPLTTLEESELQKLHDSLNESADETNGDIFAHVRKCRYLRGGNDEHELSIEEVFH